MPARRTTGGERTKLRILTGDARLHFAAKQLQELRGLGVVDSQVRRLEHVLPECRFVLRASASFTQVRDKFDELEKALHRAQHVMGKVLRGDHLSSPAYSEVLDRLTRQHFTMKLDGDEPLERTLWRMAADSAMVHRARTDFEARAKHDGGQSRHRTASFYPVQRIHEALVSGWGESHVKGYVGNEPRPKGANAMPPFPHVPSVSASKPFRRIVGICYETITGMKECDPEAAIRNYTRKRASDAAQAKRAKAPSRSANKAKAGTAGYLSF